MCWVWCKYIFFIIDLSGFFFNIDWWHKKWKHFIPLTIINYFFLGLNGLSEAILTTESQGKIGCVIIVLKDLNHIWDMRFCVHFWLFNLPRYKKNRGVYFPFFFLIKLSLYNNSEWLMLNSHLCRQFQPIVSTNTYK